MTASGAEAEGDQAFDYRDKLESNTHLDNTDARNLSSLHGDGGTPSSKNSINSATSNGKHPDTGGVLDASTPITYHYLEFETELPSPSSSGYARAKSESNASPPEPPDLLLYMNPILWSKGRKSALVWLSTVATLFTAYGAGSYACGEDQMAAEWGVSTVAVAVGIASYTAGFGFAPMLLAPFSEINGRRPMFIISGFLYFIFVLTCALTPTLGGMIVARFLVGCASSTFSTMVGGVIADIYEAKDRNEPMTIYTGGVMFGTGFGPLISGFIAQHLDWRWIFWVHLFAVGALFVAILIIFKETRGSVILSRKAQALNKWYEQREAAGFCGVDMPDAESSSSKVCQRVRWKVKSDEERASLHIMIATSLYRPFHLLVTEPVVLFFSLWISVAWAALYLNFSVIPFMFQSVYGFNTQEAYAVFAVTVVASVICTVYSIYQEKLGVRYGLLTPAPESRLYFACIEAALLPIGLFWFGWTSNASIPWIVPTLAIGFSTAGIFSVYLAVFNYLADSYHRYASSAIAAQSFSRNVLAGAFPLFTKQMFMKMGFGGGGSFLGGLALALLLVPWVLMLYGPRIRANSKICSQLSAAATAAAAAAAASEQGVVAPPDDGDANHGGDNGLRRIETGELNIAV